MGPTPLTQEELGWWQHNIGIKLTPWECRTIIKLSKEYLSESHKATKRDCPSPWAPEIIEANNKKLMAKKIRNVLRC